MNIQNIIQELRDNNLIGNIPQGHHVEEHESDNNLNHNTIWSKTTSYYNNETLYNYPDNNQKGENFSNFDERIITNNTIEEFPDTSDLHGKLKEHLGTDLLAWYRSYHWHPSEIWGIYITDKGLYYLAEQFLNNLIQKNDSGLPFTLMDLLRQSFRLLYFHEYFHFVTDMAGTVLELGDPKHHPFYLEYSRNIYVKAQGWGDKNQPLEEALANAYTYSKFCRKYPGISIKKAIRSFMDNQPNGYRGYDNFLRKRFKDGVRKLSTIISTTKKSPVALDSLEILFDYQRKYLQSIRVPLYIVNQIDDDKYRVAFLNNQISESNIEESKKFKKDYKKLSSQIKKKFFKALKNLGENLSIKTLNFKPLKAYDSIYRFRVGLNFRVTIKRPYGNESWLLLRIGPHKLIDRFPI